jgi:hypothetical protein
MENTINIGNQTIYSRLIFIHISLQFLLGSFEMVMLILMNHISVISLPNRDQLIKFIMNVDINTTS